MTSFSKERGAVLIKTKDTKMTNLAHRVDGGNVNKKEKSLYPVSYTHLTLPTIA